VTALLKNDFINEESYGVEINACAAVAATAVPMDNGFTWVSDANPNTMVGTDTAGGMWLGSSTADDDNILVLGTSFEVFQFLIGQPIRFIADITFQLLAGEINFFVGCIDNINGATVVTAGGGMKATGDHFGFYTPGDEAAAGVVRPDNIRCVSQESGVAIVTELTAANSIDRQAHPVAIGSRHQFRAEFVPTGPVPVPAGTAVVIFDAEIHFYIDGVLVAVHNHSGADQITVADTQVMDFGVYAENETDICTFEIRQLKCRQLRAQPRF
jgi:hypothetical protein